MQFEGIAVEVLALDCRRVGTVRPCRWLSDEGMDNTGGATCHPQIQGKIRRCRQTLKNRIGGSATASIAATSPL